MCIKPRTFWKKGWVSSPNYFRNYCFGQRLPLEPLEGLASEHHSVIKVLTGSKHRWKEQATTIILFPHEFHVNWIGKRLLYSDHKSSDCLLTRWLPMTSNFAAICRTFFNNFKRFCLKNGRLFLDFLLRFWNVHEI